MIRVAPAPPPKNFDARVKQRGLDAIAELVGEPPSRTRRGPKRQKVAERREDIPADAFPPFWRDVLPDMLESYRCLCSYSSLFIWPATGSPSVDHVAPKSLAWDSVYEWSNYRLACQLINSHKGAFVSVLDPFAVQDDWFALELFEYQVIPGNGATGPLELKVENTIAKLGLNNPECCKARRTYVEAYNKPEIHLSFLERHAPFIARELRRQGKLRPGDV